MTPESVIQVGEEAITITVLLAAPILLSALGIGLLVGMFQAATQIQEMTLSFIPGSSSPAFLVRMHRPTVVVDMLISRITGSPSVG